MSVGLKERICIIGAGPAGLATAHQLRKDGYENVTVLEKLPRVGGLCLTYQYRTRAFDLGANYVTSAYRETLKLARQHHASMYIEADASFYNEDTQQYQSMFLTARGSTGLVKFVWDSLRYLWKRHKINDLLSPGSYATIDEHPELLCTFRQWLETADLADLESLFEVPISLMGYGSLDEIPAPYALTYMSVPTVMNLLKYGALPWHRWPRRFNNGFQRMWQRVAEPLDVRTGVHIVSVTREPDQIVVVAEMPTEVDDRIVRYEETMIFDRLILCCPLQTSTTGKFLDLSDTERDLFEKITFSPFCVTTFVGDESRSFELHTRLVNVTPIPARSTNAPTIITQQFKDNPLVTFYTPVNNAETEVREKVIANIRTLAAQVKIDLPDEPETWDNFPYFPQVEVEDFRNGWYRTLEGLQGTNRTFYNGGIMSFELIEPIVEYSYALVARHFVGGRS